MHHRTWLVDTLDHLSAARAELATAGDSIRNRVLRHGPLVLDGLPDEQLQSQLRGLRTLFDDVDAGVHRAITILDQINGHRGRLLAAGIDVPALPADLGEPIAPPPGDAVVIPPLESDVIRQVKRERDAAYAKIRELETGVTGPPLPKDEAP